MKSIDTVTLQYNWQLWGTKAFSIMCPGDNQVDKKIASQINQAIIRFMDKSKILNYHIFNGYESTVMDRKTISVVKSPKSGIFISKELPGNYVSLSGIQPAFNFQGKIKNAIGYFHQVFSVHAAILFLQYTGK